MSMILFGFHSIVHAHSFTTITPSSYLSFHRSKTKKTENMSSVSIYNAQGDMKMGEELMSAIYAGATFDKKESFDVMCNIASDIPITKEILDVFQTSGGDLSYFEDHIVKLYSVLGAYLSLQNVSIEILEYFESKGVNMAYIGAPYHTLLCELNEVEYEQEIYDFLLKKSFEHGKYISLKEFSESYGGDEDDAKEVYENAIDNIPLSVLRKYHV